MKKKIKNWITPRTYLGNWNLVQTKQKQRWGKKMLKKMCFFFIFFLLDDRQYFYIDIWIMACSAKRSIISLAFSLSSVNNNNSNSMKMKKENNRIVSNWWIIAYAPSRHSHSEAIFHCFVDYGRRQLRRPKFK